MLSVFLRVKMLTAQSKMVLLLLTRVSFVITQNKTNSKDLVLETHGVLWVVSRMLTKTLTLLPRPVLERTMTNFSSTLLELNAW